MVEEAYRSNAGIVGPKLVDYDHPDILLEVGMAVDHYGVPFSGIEPGEVDQEQHDAVRDVFYVSDAAMLVRADLFHELGGFDPATFPGSDDLDLCWRARLAGARVLVAPDARVRHRLATVQDDRPTRRNDHGDLRAFTKSRIRVLTKAYSGLALFWVLPTAFVLNVAEAVALLFARRPGRARALLAGWFAAFAPGGDLRKARASTQRMRRVDDGDVRDLMVRGSARIRMFFTHRLHAGDRLAQVSNRTRVAVSEAGTRVRALPVIAAIALVVLVAFGSRQLVLDRIAQVGSFQRLAGRGLALVDVLVAVALRDDGCRHAGRARVRADDAVELVVPGRQRPRAHARGRRRAAARRVRCVPARASARPIVTRRVSRPRSPTRSIPSSATRSRRVSSGRSCASRSHRS